MQIDHHQMVWTFSILESIGSNRVNQTYLLNLLAFAYLLINKKMSLVLMIKWFSNKAIRISSNFNIRIKFMITPKEESKMFMNDFFTFLIVEMNT